MTSTGNYNDQQINPSHLTESNAIKQGINIFVIYTFIIAAIAMCIILPDKYLKTSLFYSGIVLSAVMFAAFAQRSKTSFFFNTFMILSFSVLFFTYGFRNFSAIDDQAYMNIFHNVANNGWFIQFKNTTIEPGYLILNHVVSTFTDDYLYMQLVSSFIPLFLFYYGFSKYRNLISMPTAVFLLCTMLFFQMLSVALVRMFIAISIVFIAYFYIPKRKPIMYIFLILIASSFHYSALFMMFLVYFAVNKRNLSKKVTRIFIILLVVCPFIFIMIPHYLVPLLGERYTQYGTIEDITLDIFTFSNVPPLILLLFFYKRFYGINKMYFKIFVFIYSISIIISLYGGMASLGRLIFYPYVAFLLGAAMVSKSLKRTSIKTIYYMIIIFYGFVYVYWTQFSFEHHIPHLFPYQNLYFAL